LKCHAFAARICAAAPRSDTLRYTMMLSPGAVFHIAVSHFHRSSRARAARYVDFRFSLLMEDTQYSLLAGRRRLSAPPF